VLEPCDGKLSCTGSEGTEWQQCHSVTRLYVNKLGTQDVDIAKNKGRVKTLPFKMFIKSENLCYFSPNQQQNSIHHFFAS
jgi:hypothetical protein